MSNVFADWRNLRDRFPLQGITTCSYLESLVGKGTHERTAELDALIADGMFYFQQAIDLYGEKKNLDVSSFAPIDE